MEKIEPGKFVSIVYDLYAVSETGEDTLVHQSDPEDPEKIIFGVTQGVIVPLEKALEGLHKGDSYDVVAKADQAFGPHRDEDIVELDKEIFAVDGKFDKEMVQAGKLVPMLTADGFRINGLVTKVTDHKVTMDFNHPLAGKSVRFVGKVLDVRDATPEEIHIATNPSGCGGCRCHGGECGDGCGCDSEHDGCGCGNGDTQGCNCKH